MKCLNIIFNLGLVVFTLFSCNNATKNPELKNGIQTDSTQNVDETTSFEHYTAYIDSLIANNIFNNPEIVLSKNIIDTFTFINDSLYQELLSHQWSILIYSWLISSDEYVVKIYPKDTKVILEFTSFNTISPKERFNTYQKPINSILTTLEYLDSIKFLKPDYTFLDGVWKCGGYCILYYNDGKIHCLNDDFGHPTKDVFTEVLKSFDLYR